MRSCEEDRRTRSFVRLVVATVRDHRLLVLLVAVCVLVAGCSSSNAEDAVERDDATADTIVDTRGDGDGALSTDGADIGRDASSDTSKSTDDASSDTPRDTSPETSSDAASDATTMPACCTADSTYDSWCTSNSEPPHAWRCFCPGGDPKLDACSINTGTLIVCCP